jgi:outer membrane receptor for ferric coprogen and ferric-rhodotorulic acid
VNTSIFPVPFSNTVVPWSASVLQDEQKFFYMADRTGENWEYNKTAQQLFMDFKQAYDSGWKYCTAL